MTQILITKHCLNEDETLGFAEWCAISHPDSRVWLLSGPLGSGKTTWVRGFMKGLGADSSQVASPTYSILHKYDLSQERSLYHLDLYRLGPHEIWNLGLEETIQPNDILIIEWPQSSAGPWKSMPIELKFQYSPQDGVRTIELSSIAPA